MKVSISGDDPVFIFVDLVELNGQTGEAIEKAILDCLYSFGFNDQYLQDHMIGFASDGASVMTGKEKGVATRLVRKFPKLLTWHCLNHRLELGVADAVDEVIGTCSFQSFMDKLYNVYYL